MPFPEFETERLVLQNITSQDKEFIFNLFSNAGVNRYLYDEAPISTLDQAAGTIEKYWGGSPTDRNRWKIVLKATGSEVGTCGFHLWSERERCADIGYDLLPSHWGKGYAREALVPLLQFMKDELGAHCIRAIVYPENTRSVKVLERMGFVLGEETEDTEFAGKTYLHHIYELRLQE